MRDVLSVCDALSGELIVDDILIQGHLLYKRIPSASQPNLFLSREGRQLFVGEYADPDIHQPRLEVFDTSSLRSLYQGAWTSCDRQAAEPYSLQVRESLSSLGSPQNLPAGKEMGDECMSDTIPVFLRKTFSQLRSIFMIRVYGRAWRRSLYLPRSRIFPLSKAGDQLYVVSPFTRSLAIYNADTLQEQAVIEDLGVSPALILVPDVAR